MNDYDYNDPNEQYFERGGCGCVLLFIVAIFVAVCCAAVALFSK